MSNKVLLQNLRDFTVQIRHSTTNVLVGMGIAVAPDGKIVTSAKVAEAAGTEPMDFALGEIGVYFPQARTGEQRAWRATVAVWAQDLVLLQLAGGLPPLPPEQIAVLGSATEAARHEFRSFGYLVAQSEGSEIALVEGKINVLVEQIEAESTQNVFQLQSTQLKAGMSGAALLDLETNLIVGLIAEAENSFWAIDLALLAQEPFCLPLRSEPLSPKIIPLPDFDQEGLREPNSTKMGISLNGAPPLSAEWVGRQTEIQALTAAWASPVYRLAALVGAGGAGKSNLARRWLEAQLADKRQSQPGGVFWWSFSYKPNLDEFFEAALMHISGRLFDQRKLASARARVQAIGTLLASGSYLFILDGLEELQYQTEDQCGLLKNVDLANLLHFFAASGHNSFCLLTSRLPVLDFLASANYIQYEIGALSREESWDLLRQLEIKDSDEVLNRLATDWQGNALALSLARGYITAYKDADFLGTATNPPLPSSALVNKALQYCQQQLSETEQNLLLLLSFFRTPIESAALQRICRAKPGILERLSWKKRDLQTQLALLKEADFQALLTRLLDYNLLRYDAQNEQYFLHPFVRTFHNSRWQAGGAALLDQAGPRPLKNYYLSVAGETPRFPTLADLAPLVEAVHLLCQTGAYEEAFQVYQTRLEQGERNTFGQQLGAYETLLGLLLAFFPNGDCTQEPQVNDLAAKEAIFATLGHCLLNLARPREATFFYERQNALAEKASAWLAASIGYRNLAGIYALLGMLPASQEAAYKALVTAQFASNKQGEATARVYQAWAAFLHGDLSAAESAFQQASALQQAFNPSQPLLYSLEGIWYADFLLRVGKIAQAKALTEANLAQCEQNRWVKSLSQCRRILGDLAAKVGEDSQVAQHYGEALRIAQEVGHSPTLLEALAARGLWAAKCGQTEIALQDLETGLQLACSGDYRIFEVQLRLGLAHLQLALGKSPEAQARYAQHLSATMGYHWGIVDATAILNHKENPKKL